MAKMEENPFPDLSISDSSFLDELEGRQKCPKCEKSRKFFCYSCSVPMPGTEDRIPRLKLPIKIDIIKHPKEVEGKSTSSHAAILAPDDVKVYIYPVIPQYTDKVVLVFPGKTSLTMAEYAEKHSQLRPTNDPSESCETSSQLYEAAAFDRVVFIDSTWYQAHQIYTDSRLTGLPKIELKSQTTRFWRYHKDKPVTYLSTVEAVYYLLREYHSLYEATSYDGQYDNLLFYFVYFYRKIRKQYRGTKILKAYEQQAAAKVVTDTCENVDSSISETEDGKT